MRQVASLTGARSLAATERALGAADDVPCGGTGEGRRRGIAPDGAIDPARLETHQFAGHALAWVAATVAGLRQIRGWAVRLDDAGALGEAEALILEIAYGEYLAQLAGGIPMAQGEFARPADSG